MYEIGKLLEKKNFKSKTLQIILPDTEIFDDIKKYKYLEYWNSCKKELEKKLKKNLSNENIIIIKKDIEEHDDIICNLPKFLDFVRGEKCMLLSDLETLGYKTLLEHIGKKK
jgi:hypothetical protein